MMKGSSPDLGVKMSTFIAAVVYGAFAVGYLAMLLLTERTAGRYVRGEIREQSPRTTIVAITPPRRARPAPEGMPVFAGLTARTR
jgi:hypothetical protein